MKEDSFAQAGAGSSVASYGHMTLPRHLAGDLPGTFVSAQENLMKWPWR